MLLLFLSLYFLIKEIKYIFLMITVNFDISLAKAIVSGARNGVIKTKGGNTVKLLYIESNYVTKDKFNILGSQILFAFS